MMLSVELRDYIEALMDARFDALTQRLDMTDANNKESIQKAYDELQRRLDILNHAHENAVSDRKDFARRDILETRFKNIEDVVASNKSEIDKSIGTNRTIVYLFGIGLTVLNLVLRFV